MQKFILEKKNHITIVSAILIIIAYVSKFGVQTCALPISNDKGLQRLQK
ncbi:hypothetical protein PAD3_0855 [Pediococcus acidilactici D3]|nr:hypothetical protein PAD3_0855 [Pediococcus acidilactici D3]